jgi:hypothetical protein
MRFGLTTNAAVQVSIHAVWLDHEYDGVALRNTLYPYIPFCREVKEVRPLRAFPGCPAR